MAETRTVVVGARISPTTLGPGGARVPAPADGQWWINVTVEWPGAKAAASGGAGHLAFTINVPRAGLSLAEWREALGARRPLLVESGLPFGGRLKARPKSAPDHYVLVFGEGPLAQIYVPADSLVAELTKALDAAEAAGCPFPR